MDTDTLRDCLEWKDTVKSKPAPRHERPRTRSANRGTQETRRLRAFFVYEEAGGRAGRGGCFALLLRVLTAFIKPSAGLVRVIVLRSGRHNIVQALPRFALP